jgi:GTP-binding protein
MRIKQAEFIISNSIVSKGPEPNMPEYAFIGRSNVGKSSLINMLTNHKGLAKISGKPGKTQLINHFLINKDWYLVDLPGYGFAKIGKSHRDKCEAFINDYILERENLLCVFVLIDSRLKPQKIDLEFMEWLGESGIAFNMVFTKYDKISGNHKQNFLKEYEKEMLKTWEEMPQHFVTSSNTKYGKDEFLAHIASISETFKPA